MCKILSILICYTFRKKRKNEHKKKLVEVSKIVEEEKPRSVEVKRTKAEQAFQKMQEKMVSVSRSAYRTFFFHYWQYCVVCLIIGSNFIEYLQKGYTYKLLIYWLNWLIFLVIIMLHHFFEAPRISVGNYRKKNSCKTIVSTNI